MILCLEKANRNGKCDYKSKKIDNALNVLNEAVFSKHGLVGLIVSQFQTDKEEDSHYRKKKNKLFKQRFPVGNEFHNEFSVRIRHIFYRLSWGPWIIPALLSSQFWPVDKYKKDRKSIGRLERGEFAEAGKSDADYDQQGAPDKMSTSRSSGAVCLLFA
jgi:hypothetical protein